MNEARIRRLLQRALLGSSLALLGFGTGCGGTSTLEGPNNGGSSATAGEVHVGGASGNGAASGSAGSAGGLQAGSAGAAGSGAGAGGAAGSGAGAGGAAGSGAGTGGAAGNGAGAGGAAGSSAGGNGGSSGNSSVCHATPPQVCAGGPITLPKSCVAEAMASVGTSLPVATCQTMCEPEFISFGCTVSAVQQTTITVQCMNGCPAARN